MTCSPLYLQDAEHTWHRITENMSDAQMNILPKLCEGDINTSTYYLLRLLREFMKLDQEFNGYTIWVLFFYVLVGLCRQLGDFFLIFCSCCNNMERQSHSKLCQLLWLGRQNRSPSVGFFIPLYPSEWSSPFPEGIGCYNPWYTLRPTLKMSGHWSMDSKNSLFLQRVSLGKDLVLFLKQLK